MSAHTPGPWEQDPTGDIGWWQIGQPGGKPVATIEHDPLFQFAKGEAKANARLIAAAPYLLEMLKRARPAVDELHGQGIRCPDCLRDNPDGSPACDLVSGIEAAIAEAEKRS